MNDALLDLLACPRHGGALQAGGDGLACAQGCRYPVVDGVPILLRPDAEQSLWVANASLAGARREPAADPYYIDTLGISPDDRDEVRRLMAQADRGAIDPVVSHLVVATCGNAYRHLKGKLTEYPLPDLRLPCGEGRVLVDLGCNWGRWTLAAARKGYRVVGVDPSIGAVMAARRLARELGLDAAFVVGDARFLPLRDEVVDVALSYSVLQHLSKEDAVLVLRHVARVLKPGGRSLIQMPSRNGIRCIYQQARRGFRAPTGFEVRYWGYGQLLRTFGRELGPTSASVDCFFGIGLQYSDVRLMSPALKVIVTVSELLRRASRWFAPLKWVADSLYLDSRKAGR